MTDTALYYTLSTIAQALASALGVVAAFALFRMSRLEADIAAAQETMRDVGLMVDELWPTLRDRGFDVFRQALREKGTYGERYMTSFRMGHAAWQISQRMRARLVPAVVATAVDVAVCIIALPFVPALAVATRSSWLVVGFAVVVSVVCVILYVRLILLIMEPRQ